MFKTLTGKFSFFFWLIFLLINISIYLFVTIYIKETLQENETQKISLMLKTLKPTIALNLSFHQTQQLTNILQTILEEKNIKEVAITSNEFTKKISKNYTQKKLKTFTYTITDPFDTSKVATLTLHYSNENIEQLYTRIIRIVIVLFVFALLIFSIFYLMINRELSALFKIAEQLQLYSKNKKLTPIKTNAHSKEIQLIAGKANEMVENISHYLDELHSFNDKLEAQVQEKIRELQKQEKMMVHQSRQAAMGEMLESIAHQWRQPLNIIGLASVGLETEYELDTLTLESFKEKINIIAENINYMSSTIDDFRNFLQPDRELYRFDPYNTIHSVVHFVSAQFKNNNIDVDVVQQKRIELLGVENEFKQVVLILLNNAKDAMQSYKEKHKDFRGHIIITLSKKGDKNIITFDDNGGGIDEEIINSIFDPYFTTKFASSGTGLGLYIAKNIVESRMQGSISVKNIARGASFTITQSTTLGEDIR